jgi:cytochrome c551/c552
VRIRDKEDGIAIDTSNVFIDMEYTELIEEPEQFGHQIDEQSHKGSELTQSLDCKSCHKEKDKSIGPSYLDVSQRYTVDDKDYLINKIVSGGSGAWGQVAMPGHPNLSKKELDQIVEWILSLTTKNSSVSTMPLRGTISPTESVEGKVLRLFARYEDMGVNGEMRLSGSDEVVLRNNVIKADDFLNVNGFLEWMEDGTPMVLTPSEEGHFEIPFVDLNKVTSIELIFSAQGNSRASFNFEVFSVSPEEKIIGKEVYRAQNDRQGVLEIAVDTKELRNFRGIIVKATSRDPKISSTDHLKLLAVRFSGN